MARAAWIAWTFTAAAITFLFGILAAVVPYGSIWVGLMFVLLGLGLGGGMFLHLYEKRPQARQTSSPASLSGAVRQPTASASASRTQTTRSLEHKRTVKRASQHGPVRGHWREERKVRTRADKDPRTSKPPAAENRSHHHDRTNQR